MSLDYHKLIINVTFFVPENDQKVTSGEDEEEGDEDEDGGGKGEGCLISSSPPTPPRKKKVHHFFFPPRAPRSRSGYISNLNEEEGGWIGAPWGRHGQTRS